MLFPVAIMVRTRTMRSLWMGNWENGRYSAHVINARSGACRGRYVRGRGVRSQKANVMDGWQRRAGPPESSNRASSSQYYPRGLPAKCKLATATITNSGRSGRGLAGSRA